MEEFASELMSKLESKTSFTIPVFNGIPIPESVLTTWIIMGIIMILTLVFVRNLKLIPTGSQNYVESLVDFLNKFFLDILGKNGRPYLAFLGTLAIYIAFSNISGVFGLTSPTKDMNVTAALAFMAIATIEFSGVHKRGFKGYLKSFAEPIPLLIPINILEIAGKGPNYAVLAMLVSIAVCVIVSAAAGKKTPEKEGEFFYTGVVAAE